MFEKLSRETLGERALTSLTGYIKQHEYKPGMVLPAEATLAAEFGVSRQVVREALRSLAGRGIVEIVNGKGAVVRSVHSEPLMTYFQWSMHAAQSNLLDLMEVRRGIEVESARLAAARRTSGELTRMTETVAAMRLHLDHPDTVADLDLQFHLAIATATRNAMLHHLVQSIRDASKDVIRLGLRYRQTARQRERGQHLHEEILAEIGASNADGAARAMTVHFEDAVDVLVGCATHGGANADAHRR